MRAVPVASCLSCLILGCGGHTNGARSDEVAARDAANASSAQADVSPDVDTEASTDANDAEASCDWTQRSSVWIGQTDTTVTVPGGDYDGGDLLQGGCVAFCLGVSSTVPDSRPEKVALILNPITDRVTGTITFGEDSPPPPPTDPTKQYPPPTHEELADGAIVHFTPPWTLSPPYPGFSYSLVSSNTSDNLLHLAFASAEVFRDWCALQDYGAIRTRAVPTYVCGCDGDGGACQAATGAIDRIDLAFDCNTMQGQLLWEEPATMLSSGPVPIRLQRVQ
jgi:hypothetical protein